MSIAETVMYGPVDALDVLTRCRRVSSLPTMASVKLRLYATDSEKCAVSRFALTVAHRTTPGCVSVTTIAQPTPAQKVSFVTRGEETYRSSPSTRVQAGSSRAGCRRR